jgi:DNA polymerase-3 subunit alpha
MDFCHLHCHTQYSLLDGAAQIKALVHQAKVFGQPAIAITDHGNLFGVPEFFTAAKKEGVQPILGCEFYVTPSGMHDRKDSTRYHQVLLAKNEEGYRHLIKLSSLSYTEGFYYKPRIDRQALRKYSAGLIATTCCLQSEILQTILRKGEDAARTVFEDYLDIFGDDYFIELQDHGIPDQKRCNAVLLRWARDYGVRVVATNDVHYVAQDDAAAQDVLLCLQTGKDLHDPTRMRFENNQFYLKSTVEMDAALADLEPVLRTQALVTTQEVAARCAFELPMGQLLMPHYPLPPAFGTDMDAYLRHLVFERARTRYPEMPQHVVERLDFELAVIRKMGFAGYFLIVQDFTTAARTLGVSVGPGRGSAAGSAVAYCLGITNIDPLQYDLLFERFLNPERVSMPDIDIDFDDRGRSAVIDYVVQKYGRQNVCQIITFGTMGARSVIRDVARVLGIPLAEADRIAKLIPEGPKENLESALEKVPEFRALLKDPNEQLRNLLHYARVLEGSARHTGVHAAGVIIAPGDISEYVPVSLAKGSKDEEDVVITQYDGRWIESFGLLKMDFLGLKTLTVLNDALALIREHHGVEIDLDQIPLDDARTYELFQRGDTVAVFQFESSGMREYLRRLRPTNIDDLIAMNALYRPGPMDLIPTYIDRKHGREPVTFPHPLLEDLLRPTYGIPVYQEQVMQMAQAMGGYTLGGADLLRRAMGKKDVEKMKKERAKFVKGAAQKNVDAKKAEEVFDLMEKFAGYGFNRSHAAAYSLVAYQTAYLKANYPAAFMAAAMTNEMGDTKKLAVVLEEARHLGLELLPPSINHSQAHFTVEQGRIRFGLGAIKGVGLGAIELLVQARARHGPFRNLFQVVRHLDLRVVNKKALESLARAGAMDDLEGHRAQLVEALDAALQYAQKQQADQAAGLMSLFGGGGNEATLPEPVLPMALPWPRAQALAQERELLGFYLSGHPLEGFAAEARAFSSFALADAEAAGIPESPEGGYGLQSRDSRPVHAVCGIITEVQRRTTQSGKPMAYAQFEDFTGQAELVVFANTLDKVNLYLKPDELVMVRGLAERRGGTVKIIVNDLIPLWRVREQMVRSIVLHLDLDTTPVAHLEQLHQLCSAHRGSRCKLLFDVTACDLPKPQRLRSRTFVVDPAPELVHGLMRLFGRDRLMLEGE